MKIKDRIESKVVNLTSLIGEAKSVPLKVYIPVQREYVWRESFVERVCYELLDIIEDEENSNEYLMQIIISTLTRCIMEGQQRLTTCLILLRVILYFYEEKVANSDLRGRDFLNEIDRFNVCGIRDEESFFRLFGYTGADYANVLNEKIRNDLSTKELKRTFNGRIPGSKISNFQTTANIFFTFINNVEEKYPRKVIWSEIIDKILFTETSIMIKEGEEDKFNENFAVINSYYESASPYTIMKALLLDRDFYKLLRSNNGKFDYIAGERKEKPEDVFVKHCFQAFFMLYSDEDDKGLKDLCFSTNNGIDGFITINLLNNNVFSLENGRDNFVKLSHEISDFYYNVVCTEKEPLINLIVGTGKLSSVFSSLFVAYHKYYEEDIEKFRSLLKYIYIIITFGKIQGGRIHFDLEIRKIWHKLANNIPFKFGKCGLNVDGLDINSIMNLMNVLSNTPGSSNKSKMLLIFLENEIRNITGVDKRLNNKLASKEERNNCDVDHFIPIGKDRDNFDFRNSLGNYFLVDKTSNRSKNDNTEIKYARNLYIGCPYMISRIFCGEEALATVNEHNKFFGLLKKIDSSKYFENSMIDLYGSLVITDEMEIDAEKYISNRTMFLSQLFSYLVFEEYLKIIKQFEEEMPVEELEKEASLPTEEENSEYVAYSIA